MWKYEVVQVSVAHVTEATRDLISDPFVAILPTMPEAARLFICAVLLVVTSQKYFFHD